MFVCLQLSKVTHCKGVLRCIYKVLTVLGCNRGCCTGRRVNVTREITRSTVSRRCVKLGLTGIAAPRVTRHRASHKAADARLASARDTATPAPLLSPSLSRQPHFPHCLTIYPPAPFLFHDNLKLKPLSVCNGMSPVDTALTNGWHGHEQSSSIHHNRRVSHPTQDAEIYCPRRLPIKVV